MADPLAAALPVRVGQPLSQLVPPETTVISPTIVQGGDLRRRPTPDVTFRHSGWARDRLLVLDALERTETAPARIERFRLCGVDSWLARDLDDPEHYSIKGSFCHDRFCKPCANARSYRIVNNLRGTLLKPPYRHVTLTLRSTNEPLTALLNLLIDSFRELRHLPWWKDRTGGGVGFIEIKYNPPKKRWHPHFHLILTGCYLDTDELSAHWHRITNGSFIVKVKEIPDIEKVLHYVCKYASKPMANTFLNRPDRLDEAIRALTGRRLCHVFGDWKGYRLYKRTDTTTWVRVCSLTDLLSLIARGVTLASAAVTLIQESLKCRMLPQPRPPPPQSLLPFA